MSTEPTTNTPQAGRLDDEWTRREARAYGYPMNAPVQPTLYTRRYHTSASTAWFHTKWGTLTLLTGGLAAPFWWLAARKRTRPITVTSQ
jgi:hypothetical protein